MLLISLLTYKFNTETLKLCCEKPNLHFSCFLLFLYFCFHSIHPYFFSFSESSSFTSSSQLCFSLQSSDYYCSKSFCFSSLLLSSSTSSWCFPPFLISSPLQVSKCFPASAAGRGEGNVPSQTLPQFHWLHPQPGGRQSGNITIWACWFVEFLLWGHECVKFWG